MSIYDLENKREEKCAHGRAIYPHFLFARAFSSRLFSESLVSAFSILVLLFMH